MIFSATLNNQLVGVIVVALDTNAITRLTPPALQPAPRFCSAFGRGGVTGTSKAGSEFVIVCSSGYFNSSNPNDPTMNVARSGCYW